MVLRPNMSHVCKTKHSSVRQCMSSTQVTIWKMIKTGVLILLSQGTQISLFFKLQTRGTYIVSAQATASLWRWYSAHQLVPRQAEGGQLWERATAQPRCWDARGEIVVYLHMHRRESVRSYTVRQETSEKRKSNEARLECSAHEASCSIIAMRKPGKPPSAP